MHLPVSRAVRQPASSLVSLLALVLFFSALVVPAAQAKPGDSLPTNGPIAGPTVPAGPTLPGLAPGPVPITEAMYLASLPDACQESALDPNGGGQFVTPAVHSRAGEPQYWEPGFAGTLDRVIVTTMRGTSGNDIIIGSTGRDRIGMEGNDTVCSGPGADVVYGGADDDLIYLGDNEPGAESYWDPSRKRWYPYGAAAAHADRAYARSGDDTVIAEGRAWLYGDGGDDTLIGGPEADELNGGTGRDFMLGGGGDDILVGNGGHDRMYGGAGEDILWGGAGGDRLYGGSNSDLLCGGTGSDRIYGNSGRDLAADYSYAVISSIEETERGARPRSGICTNRATARAVLTAL